MHVQDLAIIKGLVAVAWADGRVSSDEQEVMDALLAAYNATPSEAAELRSYAKTPRTLDDIDLFNLSADDRRVLLIHAILLSFIDGEQHEKEKQMLEDLIDILHIPPAEAARIAAGAEARAKAATAQLNA